MLKTCCRCKQQKDPSLFAKRSDSKDGLNYSCKECVNRRAREKWKEHYERSKEYREAYMRDPKNWKRKMELTKIRRKKRYHEDPMFRLHVCVSSALYRHLTKSKRQKHWEKVVGYSIDELKRHLESQFEEGMSWENYGLWHVDHIKPVNTFSFSSPTDEEFKKCWALSNLRPLWAKDNRSRPLDGSDIL